ncbi:MbtH family NRPS accessory protein [Pantoea allii]|nr:MbtH family NRPS accessory protein [Pantoea allii]THB85438.1 MbtH family NRPS accessory protein [Pantoea allii]
MEHSNDENVFEVVLNDNGQFSIWDIKKETPCGWHKAGVRGSKEVCLSYIKNTWTNILITSLKK